jgi:hypothetical protein
VSGPLVPFRPDGSTGRAGWIVRADGCWEWQGTVNAGGYPIVRVDGRLRPARRAVYEREHGRELKPEWHLYSGCDRRCVNPDHMTPKLVW